MELSKRIKAIVEYSELTTPKYAEAIGSQTPQAIRDLINGKTKTLSASMQSKILSYMPELSQVWLMTGEGEMFMNADEDATPSNEELLSAEKEVPEQFISYVVPLAAMGGSLIGFEDEGVRREDCERIVSPIANIDWVVPVCGDSMEPEYPNGSKVYVRQINPRDFIPWGNVFVLDTTNGLIIKMVVQSDKKDHIRCVSLNPSGRYDPFDVPTRTIRAMYRVMLCVAVK